MSLRVNMRRMEVYWIDKCPLPRVNHRSITEEQALLSNAKGLRLQ